jgi:hypothetical protein
MGHDMGRSYLSSATNTYTLDCVVVGFEVLISASNTSDLLRHWAVIH